MSIIQTSRLDMRLLNLQDDEFILELLNDPGFLRYIGDKGVRTLADAREYITKGPGESYEKNGFGLYATCLRVGTPIGICGLVKRDGLDHPDVGFAFLTRYWAKGYGVESAAAVLHFAATSLKLPRIVAITAPENAGSIAILEKIGLRFERMVRLAQDSPELKLFGPGLAKFP